MEPYLYLKMAITVRSVFHAIWILTASTNLKSSAKATRLFCAQPFLGIVPS